VLGNSFSQGFHGRPKMIEQSNRKIDAF